MSGGLAGFNPRDRDSAGYSEEELGKAPQRHPGPILCPLCGLSIYRAQAGHEGDPESFLTCDACRKADQR